jgi:hypothetical protein
MIQRIVGNVIWRGSKLCGEGERSMVSCSIVGHPTLGLWRARNVGMLHFCLSCLHSFFRPAPSGSNLGSKKNEKLNTVPLGTEHIA